MTGGPDSWALTVQWDGTTFVDESASLKADSGSEITVSRGRRSIADDVQTGVLSGVLDNTGGRFTPDNPLSALWPNLNDAKAQTRFTVTIGGVASDRHRGRLALGQPVWPRGQAAAAVVPFESVGLLGQQSRERLSCDFVERHRYSGRTGLTVDVFPFDESADAGTTDLRNVGNGTGTGQLVPAVTRAGSSAREVPEGIDLESSIVLSPKDGVGPVIQVETGIASGSVLGIVVPFRTADRTAAGGASKYVARGLDAAGLTVWSVRLVDNAGQCDLNLYDSAGAFVSTLYFGFSAIGAAAGDDQWFALVWQYTGTSNALLYRCADNAILANTPVAVATIDVRKTDTVVLGGLGGGKRLPGKQTQCTTARFGAVAFTTSAGSVHPTYLRVNAPTNLTARFQDVSLYRNYAIAVSGVREASILQTPLAGRDPLDVIAELCRTTGTTAVESRDVDARVVLRRGDVQRLSTVAVTVDLAADVDGSNGFPTRKGGTPSSVTATWPGGKVTYTDASRLTVTGTIDTCAASSGAAFVAASARVNAGRRLRIESLRVDFAGSASALWPTFKDIEVGARIRVTLGTAGSPFVTQVGRTYVDVYAVGWTEHYADGVAWWEIDTEPADDPVQGEFGVSGSPLRRRKFGAAAGAMTVTGGTCVGSTGTGTIVVTTASGPTFTTVAAAYPMDVAWNGEDVTVSAAPASAVSPQTLTVTARGAAGTVARVHVAGEPVNVAQPAAFGY